MGRIANLVQTLAWKIYTRKMTPLPERCDVSSGVAFLGRWARSPFAHLKIFTFSFKYRKFFKPAGCSILIESSKFIQNCVEYPQCKIFPKFTGKATSQLYRFNFQVLFTGILFSFVIFTFLM